MTQRTVISKLRSIYLILSVSDYTLTAVLIWKVTQINTSGFDILYWGAEYALPFIWEPKDFWLSPLMQMSAPLASACPHAANYSVQPPPMAAK